MNHLKDYLKTRVEYMLTYADENAKGFFKKQGFSETILIDRAGGGWVGRGVAAGAGEAGERPAGAAEQAAE